jgi:type II secretory pathway pseudopilin PulG
VHNSLRDERGMTIIEMTVMLSVMFILAGMISPIMSTSVTTARTVKAEKEVAMLATAMLQLQQDIGATAIVGSAAAASQLDSRGAAVQAADVLSSEGEIPAIDDSAADNPIAAVAQGVGLMARPAASVFQAQRRRWTEARHDALDSYLVNNDRGYHVRRPGESTGWNGPYVSTLLPGDPWGKQYMVNARWLDGGSTAADANGYARRAVYIVSAGANGVVETPFEQKITDARVWGDDIVIRIQ